VKYSGKKIRLKDIASLAGVSIGTVDRVIHNRGEVAEKTKIKIQNILQETNYSPNIMARVLKSKKRFQLVSLLPEPTETNSYWQKHPQGMMSAMEELELFHVTLTRITFNIQSEKDFLKKTEEVLLLNPDGVIFAPIFKSESVGFCSILENKGIPVVLIDGYIENTHFLAYIGEDVFRSGRVAGQLTDMITPESKDILTVNITRNIKNVHHLNKRLAGFLDYFENSGRNTGKKINVNIPDPSTETVKTEMDNIIELYPNIGSLFISGSKLYLIAQYLEERGIRSFKMIGYDLLDLNVKYLKLGFASFLIGQRPEEQAYKGIKKLFEYLSLNKMTDKMEYLPIDIVNSENVDFFIKFPYK
jgi:LacI family transcriptional regulator